MGNTYSNLSTFEPEVLSHFKQIIEQKSSQTPYTERQNIKIGKLLLFYYDKYEIKYDTSLKRITDIKELPQVTKAL